MRHIIPTGLLVLLVTVALNLPAQAVVNVVASVPDLGDMARCIGGDRIKVTVLASGREDLHGVPARPSFIPKLNRADLLFTLGLDAEHAWLPALAAEARNNRILEDHEGWIETCDGVEILDIPTLVSRSEGEQHAEGNPHINVGPQNGPIMAENIAYALMEIDPEGSDFYQKNLDIYVGQLNQLIEELSLVGAPLKGVKIISYHADVSYLAKFYGMKVVGSLESKPGIEPSARHLAKLAKTCKEQGVKLVIFHQAQSAKLPGKFAQRIGARSVQFGNMVGSLDGVDTFIKLQEHNLKALLVGLDSQ